MKGLKTAQIAHKKLNVEAVKKSKADVKPKKTEKASKKNPGAPKRPLSAFLIFMEDFRKSYKENFPDNKSIAAVSKAGGEKWKAMSDSEKAPYQAKAEKKKVDYGKAVEEFNKKLNNNGEQKTEESDMSSTQALDDGEQEASSLSC